ncbi:MAG: heat-shock protein [Mariprofundaceae bacterium]|nr:heat-shock protein [Mariprofundaceae bacterium]
MNTLAIIALLSTIVTGFWILLIRPSIHDEHPQETDTSDKQRVSALLRGIHHLLSDKPSLAIQDMVEVARLRSESIEVYMALGEMFLSQGEIGRAVRIHQNILARPKVPQPLYIQAHFALANDFQTGGLLDRALRHYQKVLDVQSDHLDALIASLRIREMSHEWKEAESLLSRIERLQNQDNSLHGAYLCAEMAEESLQQGNHTQARQHAEQALQMSDDCIHAYLIMIAIELAEKNIPALSQYIDKMNDEKEDYLHLLVPMLQAEHPELLMQCWQDSNNHELALTWLETLAQEKEHRQLEQNISIHPKHLRESLRLAALGKIGDDCLIQYAQAWRTSMKRYHCEQCGIDVVEMYWQCPQCHTWGTSVLTEQHGIKE